VSECNINAIPQRMDVREPGVGFPHLLIMEIKLRSAILIRLVVFQGMKSRKKWKKWKFFEIWRVAALKTFFTEWRSRDDM